MARSCGACLGSRSEEADGFVHFPLSGVEGRLTSWRLLPDVNCQPSLSLSFLLSLSCPLLALPLFPGRSPVYSVFLNCSEGNG